MRVRVRVYYNLHRKCWSIQWKGRVIAHLDTVHLSDCRFRVSEAGRQRVLREGRKNVHAYVEGILLDEEDERWTHISTREYTYDPYRYQTFVNRRTERTVLEADGVVMHRGRVYGIGSGDPEGIGEVA